MKKKNAMAIKVASAMMVAVMSFTTLSGVVANAGEAPAPAANQTSTTDWVVLEDDSKEIKAAKEEDQKSKAAKDAAQKAREKVINKAGAQLGEYVNDLIDGKFNNATEAYDAGMEKVAKFLVNDLAKEIPYAGGLISTVAGHVLGIEEETVDPMAAANAKLDDINNNIVALQESVKTGTNQITDTLNRQVVSSTFRENMNKSAADVQELYRLYNNRFAQILVKLQNGEYMNKSDDEVLSEIFSYGNGKTLNGKEVEGGYRIKYYNTYMDFSSALLNEAFIPDFTEFGGNNDVFGFYDMVVNCDSKLTSLEKTLKRDQFANKVETVYGNGYEVLRAAMMYDLDKLMVQGAVAAGNIVQIQQQIEAGTGDITALETKRQEYVNMAGYAETGIKEVESKIGDLDAKYEKVNGMIEAQKKIIKNEYEAYCANPVDGLNYGKVAYYMIDGKVAYDNSDCVKNGKPFTTVFQNGTGEFSKMVDNGQGSLEFVFRNPIQGTESITLYDYNGSCAYGECYNCVALNQSNGYSEVVTAEAFRNGVIAKNVVCNAGSLKTEYTFRDGHKEYVAPFAYDSYDPAQA